MHQIVDSASFRQIMGRFATGIAVVTAQNAALGAFGLTINSLTSVSLDPCLLLFCLDKAAHLYGPLHGAGLFAVNLLSADQESVSRYFASRDYAPRLDHLWDAPQQSCPVLAGTLGWALCRPHAHHAGGDHTIFVGEVIDLYKSDSASQPLLYFQGAYRKMAGAIVTSGARR